jgi:Serine/threonine protein kinase
MNTNVVLKFNTGKCKGTKKTFSNNQKVIVGRDEDNCTLIIPDSYKTVSRIHCSLYIDAPFVLVDDHGSTNGTWIKEYDKKKVDFDFSKTGNKKKGIQRTNVFLMKPGDILVLGGGRINNEGKVEIKSCELRLEYLNLNDYFETVDDDFIGEGKMGFVRKVEDINTKCPMAVKMLKTKIDGVDEKNMERIKGWFLREFYNGRQLNHNNVVKYYYLGLFNNRPAIIMEDCGKSLENLLLDIDKKNMEEKIALATEIILQALDGIDHIHNVETKVTLADNRIYTTKGMVHRDLRPANILLMDGVLENPVVKIVDLGFTKAYKTAGLTFNTFNGEACGDWNYVPKQQVVDYCYVEREADIWSLFATYYRILVGKTPKGDFSEKEKNKSANTTAIDILKMNPNIPKKLADIINKGLIDNPKIEITTAEDAKKRIMEAFK